MAQIKKHYPIENREDFFKYIIVDEKGNLYKDFENKEMYFDCLEHAKSVKESIEHVEKINKDFLNV